MKKLFSIIGAAGVVTLAAKGQVLLSGGLTYSQNFDSLSNSPPTGTPAWTDNGTAGLTGWYASRAFLSGTASAYGPFAFTTYKVGDGSANSGSIYSFGTAGATDRALGSVGSGTPKTNVFGVRIQNDTGSAVGTVTISYTGEQWRNGGNTVLTPNTLAFSYQVSSTPFTSPIGVDSAPNNGWTGFTPLDFVSPNAAAGSAAALDGNAAGNRTVFSNILLPGVTVNPGQEIFIRWLDIDDTGNDHALAVDDFSVSFSQVPEPSAAVLGGLAVLSLTFSRRRK